MEKIKWFGPIIRNMILTHKFGNNDFKLFWLWFGMESPLNMGFLLIIWRCLLDKGPVISKNNFSIVAAATNNISE